MSRIKREVKSKSFVADHFDTAIKVIRDAIIIELKENNFCVCRTMSEALQSMINAKDQKINKGYPTLSTDCTAKTASGRRL